jgi:hypothetical protein
MTTRPKAARFFLRRVDRQAPPAAQSGPDLPFDTQGDGFGNVDFRSPGRDGPAEVAPAQAGRPIPGQEPDDAALAAIAAEGLTGKQLRRARLVAQQHGITPRSDLDAILQLRRIGIDPFSRTARLEMVPAGDDAANGWPHAGANHVGSLIHGHVAKPFAGLSKIRDGRESRRHEHRRRAAHDKQTNKEGVDAHPRHGRERRHGDEGAAGAHHFTPSDLL